MTTEHTAFSSSGTEAISRTIDVKPDQSTNNLSPAEFNDFYEIERTVEEVERGDYRRIALQFPDELLHASVPVYKRLKSRLGTGRELYVLADTSYGSCCVDEVAAQHVNADVMVHYGHACMTQTSRLPVIYVFGKKPLDVNHCVDTIMRLYSSSSGPNDQSGMQSTLVLRHNVVYTHQAETILRTFKEALEPLSVSIVYEPIATITSPRPPERLSDTATASTNELPPEHTIFYIGGESLGLTNILMTNSGSNVFSYDPSSRTARLESSRTNQLLMRRYAVLQRARDADVFGILVGTLGVASYLPLIRHLRTLLGRNRKKSYTISVGKLNPSKLANFLEIECFVLVACPENSLIDSREFYRPIVTPYELEVALQAEPSWSGRYVLDFGRLLVEHAVPSEGEDALPGEEEDDDRPFFSLVTGTYRHARRYGGKVLPRSQSDTTDAVVLRNQDNAIAKLSESAAGQFLQTRSYKGLETRIGQDAPSVLEQGRSGIARGYQDDHR